MGPRINKKNPLLIGGAIAVFEELVNQFDKHNIRYHIIDTNKKNYSNIFTAYLSIIVQSLMKQRGCTHISLHSSRDYMFLGLIIIFIGKVFKKQTSLRKFGGEASEVYTNSKGIKKRVLKFIFSNMDVLFFEIKHVVQFFSKININCFWFPNVRNRLIESVLPRKYKKKFVFISHIKKEKGIDEILEASMQLDSSYTIDIYGFLMDKKYNIDYFENYNVSYRGALEANTVIDILNEYDVVLLPSYKEGYPGIIIEAYSLGIPVISTTLKNIEEIVDSYKTGILVKPGNIKELMYAMKYFNDENYSKISENAYKKFDDFKSDIQTKLFLERLINV